MLSRILFITFASGVFSLIGSYFLSFKKHWPQSFTLKLTAFSSGILLSTALLHLAPESMDVLTPEMAFQTIFGAIVAFFVLERLVLWHHNHDDD